MKNKKRDYVGTILGLRYIILGFCRCSPNEKVQFCPAFVLGFCTQILDLAQNI